MVTQPLYNTDWVENKHVICAKHVVKEPKPSPWQQFLNGRPIYISSFKMLHHFEFELFQCGQKHM